MPRIRTLEVQGNLETLLTIVKSDKWPANSFLLQRRVCGGSHHQLKRGCPTGNRSELKGTPLNRVTSLEGLPDILVVAVLDEVVQKGKLNERVLDMALAPGHDLVNTYVKRWNIRRLPFLPPPTTGKRWLGEKPGYY